MYFVKTHEEPVAMDTVSSHVMVGDFFAQELRGQGNPLQYFDAMSHDVFLPLVSSASIVGAWPDTLTKEVMGQLHKMLANIHRTIATFWNRSYMAISIMAMLATHSPISIAVRIHL